MERRNQAPSSFSSSVSSSSSSITSELFGSREARASSSSGIFGSIFEPSSKVFQGESLSSETIDKKLRPPSGSWNKETTPDYVSKRGDGESHTVPDRDSIYQEQRVLPCHLSSSIYYGGQDIYVHPQNTSSYPLNSTVKQDVGEDDSGVASRGNWWQGSLYY